jgi:hypothetical protein
VVDSDPTRVPVETIKNIGVALTIINGVVVYSKKPTLQSSQF